MNLKIAIIKWIDSTYYRIENLDGEEEMPLIKPKVLISVGLLLYEDDDCLIVSQDVVPGSEFKRTTLSIPKVSVHKYHIETIKIDDF